VRQQRLPFGLGFGDQRSAVGDGDKASGHVVDEKRDTAGMAAVAHRQRAAGVGVGLRIGERRLRAEGDVRHIEAVPRQRLERLRLDAAAVDDCRVEDR
jgi:hypothetical protein